MDDSHNDSYAENPSAFLLFWRATITLKSMNKALKPDLLYVRAMKFTDLDL